MTAIGQSGFLEALGWAVLNSLWQMALLWVVFQLLSGVFKSSPSHKSTLAVLMLVSGFAWFLFTFLSILSVPFYNTILIDYNFADASGNEKLSGWLHQTLPVAAVTYILLLLFPLFQFRRNYRYVRVIRNVGLSKINVEWRIFSGKLAALMGIKKPVQIWISELVSSPVTVGFLKPVILIPVAAVNHLTTQQLEAVLLHELSHIRRHDYLVNLLVNGIRTLLYFNPFVNLFIKSIEREREKSCDEMVIRFRYDPRGYATALLQLEKANTLTKPFAVAASGNKKDFLHRIEMILGINNKPGFSFNRLAGLFAGLLFAIGFNALLILSRPLNGIKPSVYLSHISSPFYLFTDDKIPAPEKQQATTYQATTAQTGLAPDTDIKNKDILEYKKSIKPDHVRENPDDLILKTATIPVVNVNLKTSVAIPQLKNYQELQVKKAMDASKRIIEEIEWKNIEKNIADVFTKIEKEKIRSLYKDALEKYDWHGWEDKIRLSYNTIDWEKINEDFGKSISKIKLDSLQNVYLEAAGTLETMLESLKENNQTFIPDTDITIQKLEQNKQRVKKTLNTITGMRTRKIIHL